MPLARIDGTLLFFAHIPKTGGSSIEAYIQRKGSLSMKVSLRPEGFPTTPQHFHRDVYDQLFPRNFYDHGFAVLRDPVDRLVSEYLFRSERPRRWQRTLWLGMTGSRRRVRLDRHYPVLSFEGWVDRILAICRGNPLVNDNHIRPQVDFVHPDHRLFLFEDGLMPVFRWIDEVTGTPPIHEAFHEKRSPRAKPKVSPALRERIARFYAEDYALIERLKGTGPQPAQGAATASE